MRILHSQNIETFSKALLMEKTPLWLGLFVYTFYQNSCGYIPPEPPPDLFYRYTTLQAADGPSDILAHDLNLDNSVDLIIANMRGHVATLYYGEGDGSFSNRSDLKVLPEPSKVVSADLNRDGLPDIVLNSRGANALSILTGTSGGFFSPTKALKTGKVPLDIILEDFNHDGLLDAAVTLTFHKMEIHLGTGLGTFKQGETYLTGSRSNSGVSADFNEDGNPDIALAVTSPAASSIRIFAGLGDGTFREIKRLAKGQKPLALATNDMNEDGHMDLLTATGTHDNMIMSLGNGNGTFREPFDFSGGGGPLDLTINHFNGDGLLDVAVVNSRSSSFSIIYQKKNGSFRYPSRDYIVDGGSPIAITSADFNNDGMADIAVSSDANNTVEVFLQKREQKTNLVN